ncbi:ribosomal RNA adenine methyltransferase KsgA/Erm [Glomus cerebriforme]|uniref:rRNA adenine N(6)-methyltransferase n=1 Tax=Glomus cerebriforme TaxID=658196 RepID=A0A397TLS0_9GLOM|nr:ribosomal RNA adenine methyltransferase KsgA/Erm [Glomus cerebriforme]
MWTPTVLKRALGQKRVSLNNMRAAVEVLEAIKIPDNATIIEISPGMGFLTHAFLHHTNARKILALEKENKYINELSILAKESNGRLEVLNADVWDWSIYDMLKHRLTNLQVHSWEEVHPNLISVVHFPNTTKGEILLNKLLSNCHNKCGLHYFGRSRMNLIVPEKPAEKLLAKKGEIQRHKIKIEVEAVADIEVLKFFSEKAFVPNVQCVLFGLTPHTESKITAPWHTFQYVIKNLTARKNSRLIEMLR